MQGVKVNPLTAWKRGIARGMVNVLRESDWPTALGALVGIFLILQIILFGMMGMEGFQRLLKTNADVRLEVNDGASAQEVQRFLKHLEETSSVNEAHLITKESLYIDMRKQDPELVHFLEQYNLDNPFPDTIAVTLNQLEDYDKFSAAVMEDQWKDVVDPNFLSSITDQETQVFELLRITHAAWSLTIFFLALTVGILFIITIELMRSRVQSRSDEILVQHLAGTTSWNILLPFVVEAILMLLIAALMSVIIFVGIVSILPYIAPAFSQEGILSPLTMQITALLKQQGPILFAIELISIPIVGFLAAWFGTFTKLNTGSLTVHR
jgi:cell division transport system permease protein